MQNPDLSYRSSPLAHMCYLVAEALRGPASQPEVTTPVAPAPRAGWLDRLDAWAWRRSQRAREAYLAEAVDLADLERRLQDLERPLRARDF